MSRPIQANDPDRCPRCGEARQANFCAQCGHAFARDGQRTGRDGIEPTTEPLAPIPGTTGVVAIVAGGSVPTAPASSAGRPSGQMNALAEGDGTGLFPGWAGMRPPVAGPAAGRRAGSTPRRRAWWAVLAVVTTTALIVTGALFLAPAWTGRDHQGDNADKQGRELSVEPSPSASIPRGPSSSPVPSTSGATAGPVSPVPRSPAPRSSVPRSPAPAPVRPAPRAGQRARSPPHHRAGRRLVRGTPTARLGGGLASRRSGRAPGRVQPAGAAHPAVPGRQHNESVTVDGGQPAQPPARGAATEHHLRHRLFRAARLRSPARTHSPAGCKRCWRRVRCRRLRWPRTPVPRAASSAGSETTWSCTPHVRLPLRRLRGPVGRPGRRLHPHLDGKSSVDFVPVPGDGVRASRAATG